MHEEKTSLGPWLYWSLLIIVTLSFGLINVPYHATEVMGANGYLAIPVALVLAIPPLAAIYQVMKRFPALNLLQAGLKITGPFCGRLCGLGYLTVLLLLLVLFTRDRVNLIKDYLLPNTPLSALTITYLLSAGYLASRGIETISRLASFVVLPILIVLLLMAVGVLPEINVNRLRPVFHPDLKLYLPGGLSVLYSFAPLAIFALVTPYLRGIQRKIPRYTGGALLVLVFYYMLFTVGVIGTFGSEHGRNHAFPALEMVRAMEYPYLLLEQAGLFMIIVWNTLALVGSGFIYYVVALGFSQILGLLDYKRLVWVLLPVKYFLVLYPQNMGETRELLEYAANYGWIPFFGLPVFYYLCALVLRKGEDGR
ncbi:endospore germination permease [Hydrogenispora sp. UU3]|uniref:Endospore germination permease n=2 Tax=Capillibacterium thermochitinicola TaxID=2699427 RepID=A0A8J6LML7_9FIRM|nr:endospore germination permease [Capillibacterium thermochitinicola]